MAEILVLGIGNTIMSDDGAGPVLVSRMEDRYLFPEGVEILDGGTLGLDLLPKLEGVAKLLVVDAISGDSPPGSILRLSGEEVPIALKTKLSPHQMGLQDLLAVAELQGCLPGETVLWGIVPQEIEMGVELSPPVAAGLDGLEAGVLRELERWGVCPEERS